MKTPVKLGLFALSLLVVFAASWGLGRIAGPSPATATPHQQEHAPAPEPKPPGGLQVAQDGYRLEPITRQLSTVDKQPFTFRVIGPDGKPVTAYTKAHEKDLHLIVVRRDLTGFQHVHPELGADGVWSVPLQVPAPGSYRVFADFQPAARQSGLILGVDVNAHGDFQPRPQATLDGYEVKLEGRLEAGTLSHLTFSVSKEGKPVTDLEPYLGALGHLVVLREGDLAYLHVHPEGGNFYAEVPSEGNYGLFLDFKHNGVVRTAQFSATTHGH